MPSGDTDDLVQEGMVALFNAIMNYDEKPARVSQRSPTSASEKNHRVNQEIFKRENRALNDSVPLDDVEIASGNPETVYIEEERETLLMREIESVLSEEEQRIFYAYLDGDSYREIAASLSVSTKKSTTPCKNKKIAEKSLNR